MASKKQLTLSVIKQTGIVYYGNVDAVFVPDEKGIIAIMAYHSPMIIKLGAGKVSIREGRKNTEITVIKHGVLYVGENEVKAVVS